MKVLIWVGGRFGDYDLKSVVDLARVWVDDDRKVHVEALEPRFERFALEVQEDIDKRIADPRAGFYRVAGEIWTERDGTSKSVRRQEIAQPGDANFLEVLMSDYRLNGGAMGRNIAGYEIWDGGSRIIEE